jgi:5,5'-dehydrodivanillate O-demethylase oxygenase subunit
MAATASPPTSGYTSDDWNDFVHTGPGTLAGRYMRLFWHPVARGEDLGPGELQPIRILSQDFTLYRGESGAPHLLDFRCAHRRTQLNTGWVEGENVRCYFHGWVYDQQGQCIEQPAEPQPFCERIKIGSYPTREYLGLIFAYLGEGEPPPFRRFLAFEGRDDCVVINNRNQWAHNFMASQVTDPAHGNFVHAASYQEIGRDFPESVRCEETEYGHTTTTKLQNGKTWINHFIFPNINHAKRFRKFDGQYVTRETLGWRIPIDDENHLQLSIWLDQVPPEHAARHAEEIQRLRESARELTPIRHHAERVLRGEVRIENLGSDASIEFDQQRLFNIQDYVALLGMGAVPDLHAEHLGSADLSEITNRQIWARELRALAEGRPTKQWNPMVELSVAASG